MCWIFSICYLIFRKNTRVTTLILIKKTDHYKLKTKDNILNKLEKKVTPKVPTLIKNSSWYLNFSGADSKYFLNYSGEAIKDNYRRKQ